MQSRPNMVAVSVIINCYNGEKFLEKAINSIYAQTFSDWEIIFFDNKSSDRSASIAKKFDRKLKYYCATKHISLGEARNEAILLCSGKWVCFLDVDDVFFHLEDIFRVCISDVCQVL